MRFITKAKHNRLTTNTLILLGGSAGGAVLSFALSVLIGRVLGDEGLGIYAAALAWILPISVIVEFGLGTLLVRDVAQTPTQTGAYVASITRARLLMGGAAWVALWLFAPHISANDAIIQALYISAPLVLILPLFGTFTAVFRAHQVMVPVAGLNVGMLLAQVLLTVLAFLLGGGVMAALAINTLTSAGQCAVAWWLYRRRFNSGEHHQMLALWPLLRRAWPFAIAAVLGAAHLRVGFILLEQLASIRAVGYFTAAMRFFDAVNLFARAFFDALFPLLAGMAANRARLDRFFRWVQIGLVAAGLVGGVVLVYGAEMIIAWTYGAAFVATIPVLQVVGMVLLPALLKSARTLYWYARGYEQFVNGVTVVALLVRVALSAWLISAYGALGAALAHFATEVISWVLLLRWRV